MDTATSKTSKVIWVMRRIRRGKLLALAVWLPSRVNKRCPAIIFADRRTANVPGRIVFLIVSIITMKDMRADGVPWGTKWASIELVKFTHPIKIKDSHKGRANVKVVSICLVLVKINGNNPIKFLRIIKIKRLKENTDLPTNGESPNKVLISICSVFFTDLKIKLLKFGINQNRLGIKIKGIKNLIQFLNKKVEEDGSKLENNLFIIFI